MERSKIDSWRTVALMVGGLVLLHLLISFIGWNNPIVEEHGFRQTQTALTSYWLLRGSPLLAYETPVLGPPWALPIEFPIFQGGVALVSKVTGIALDRSGRIGSLFFFYAGLAPVFWLIRRLGLPAASFAAFGVLYLTSPLFLFWSRAFLMESTAAALSLGYLALCWVVIEGRGRQSMLWLAALLGSLAALVKVTTFAGALGAVCLLYLLSALRARPTIVEAVRSITLAVVLPLGVELGWLRFSDAVKLRNPLQYFAASEGVLWYFGAPRFRFSRAFWSTVVHRMLPQLLGKGWIVVVIICVLLWMRQRTQVRTWGAVMGAAFWGTTIVFANVHYVHTYYQCGTAPFLYLGLAIVGGVAWQQRAQPRAVLLVLLVVLLGGNARLYYRRYYPSLNQKFAFVEAARFVGMHTAGKDIVLGYGSDWDSTIAYYSGRRTIMDRLYRPIASAQIQDAFSGLRPDEHVRAVVACEEAIRWGLERVQENVAALGLNGVPGFDDGHCRVYTGAAAADGFAPRNPSDRLHTPPEMIPVNQNPEIDLASFRVVEAHPFSAAMTEGPALAIGVLANPDTVLSTEIPPSSAGVQVRYGNKEYAWRLHHAGAVEFSLEIEKNGLRTPLWRKTLDPGRQAADRGEQSAEVTLPPGGGRLLLVTKSADQSMYQRAYWTGIHFRQVGN